MAEDHTESSAVVTPEDCVAWALFLLALLVLFYAMAQ